MIVEQLENADDGTELVPSECGISINAPGASVHYAFGDSIEIHWLIDRLKQIQANMQSTKEWKATQVAIEEGKARFAIMRQMLAESGADGRNQ